MRQALMRLGRNEMPTRSMAMTKGEAAAFEAVPRRGSLRGVMMPMMKTPICERQGSGHGSERVHLEFPGV